MFIQVRLLHGFREPLWYQIPHDWDRQQLLGALVIVPLRSKNFPALVEQCTTTKPSVNFEIKFACSWQLLPADVEYKKLLAYVSWYYQVPQLHLLKRLRTFLMQSHEKISEDIPALAQKKKEEAIILTQEQQAVVDFINPFLQEEHKKFVPTVLHGVTGSGKTEVYKRLIENAYALGKSTILLLPEVSLAVNFTFLLKQQLPSTIEIYSFHSATSIKDKRALWHHVRSSRPVVIVGVHLPILLPIDNLGLIIIDEEHDAGFQEKKYPKINNKEVAIWRAQQLKIPILLGSATPSLSSLHRVKTAGWHFFQLKKRFAGVFPQVQLVKMDALVKRRNFWISRELEHAIKDRLAKKEQAILFLNRRGVNFFVQCKECNFIFSCAHCSVSLTRHEDNILLCHYCGFSIPKPSLCTQCKTDEKNFLHKGIGTQQLVTILSDLFPQARIARADVDATINKKKWQQTIHNFKEGEIDILVGTQTITKGYHFPRVTLVGVIWADLNLHFPLFNASEIVLQQLIQVAGRAGRQLAGGTVIVQTMMHHSVFEYLNEIDYLKFYAHEIQSRAAVGYPPVLKLAEIELSHEDETVVEEESARFIATLQESNNKRTSPLLILGPAKPLVHKIKNTFSRKIYIKGSVIKDLITLYSQSVSACDLQSSISCTPIH